MSDIPFDVLFFAFAGVSVLLLVGFVVFLVRSARLKATLETERGLRDAAEAGFSERLRDKEIDCEKRLAERSDQCRREIEEKNREFDRLLAEKQKSCEQMVETLRERFSSLAAEKLKAQSDDLSAQNAKRLQESFKGIQDQLAAFREATGKAQLDANLVKETIHRDVESIGKIAKDLSDSAAILKGNNQIQGRTGEEILADKLRQAGLEENVSFFLQTGTHTDRPDAQVTDAGNRWLVIDSKVSLTNFIEYSTASDPAVRAEKLKAHVLSVRNHVDELVRKKYPETLGRESADRDYLPVTAMFVPYEAPLMVALEKEPALLQYAAEHNIVIVTPLTLLAYLRLVFLAWQHEKAIRNEEKIVETATELLYRMNEFLRGFEKFGKGLESLQKDYESASKLLIEAPNAHTIAKSAQKLIDLHVRLENSRGKKIDRAACLCGDSTDEENSPVDIEPEG